MLGLKSKIIVSIFKMYNYVFWYLTWNTYAMWHGYIECIYCLPIISIIKFKFWILMAIYLISFAYSVLSIFLDDSEIFFGKRPSFILLWSKSSLDPISTYFERERIFDLFRERVLLTSTHFLFGNFLILHLFLFGWISSLHLEFLLTGDRSLWNDSF